MKTPSDDLYQLIKNLTQAEKRYFMLFAKTLGAGRENKSYTELFTQLNKQKEFNEKRIKKDTSPIQFKKLKHYTTSALMRAMENYHAESSAVVQINRLLIQIEILYNKKQFKIMRKSLNKLTALVNERNLLQYMFSILHWEYKLSIDGSSPSQYLNILKKIDTDKIASDCKNWMTIRKLNAMFWNIIATSASVEAKERKELNYIVREAEKIFYQKNNGYTIKRETANALGLANRFLGNTQESYKWRKIVLETTESNKKLLNERGAEYIVSIGNLMNTCLELNRDNELLQLFEKAQKFMNALPVSYYDQRLDERYCNLLNSRISYLYLRKNYKEVIQLSNDLYKKLLKHSSVFQNSILNILYQNIIYSAFYIRDFKTCLHYYNLWLRDKTTDDIDKKLFGIILFFEQGDTDLCYYRCKSLGYALRSKNNKHPFAKILLTHFIQTVLEANNKAELNAAFKTMYNALSKNNNCAQYIKQNKAFDYLNWLGSKIQ